MLSRVKVLGGVLLIVALISILVLDLGDAGSIADAPSFPGARAARVAASNTPVRREPTATIAKSNVSNCHNDPRKEKDTRRYLSPPTARGTALLYSFPGSGNTWLRLLLDWSTNVYSGSVYNDKSLFGILPGEKHCDSSVSVVKAHPHLQSFKDFTSVEHLPKKCAALHLPVKKIIFLIRDPYDAIWSEFQRKRARGRHNQGLSKRIFHQPAMVHRWKSVYRDLAQKYVAQFQEVDKFRANGAEVLVVRFEELANLTRRVDVLERAIRFLSLEQRRDASCAFALAESPVAHRSIERLKKKRRRSGTAEYMTKNDAYSNKTHVCNIWKVLGKFASENGYKTFGRDCDF
jgi:hypothetical protein